MHTESWTEWIKGTVLGAFAFLTSLYAFYKLGMEWIKERSYGSKKVRELEDTIKRLSDACEKDRLAKEDLARRVERNESEIDKLNDDLRRNLQESMNILMRGNK